MNTWNPMEIKKNWESLHKKFLLLEKEMGKKVINMTKQHLNLQTFCF